MGEERIRITRDFSKYVLFVSDHMIWLMLVGVYVGFGILRPEGMLNIYTLRFILYSSVPLTFYIIAEGLIMIAGEYDISLSGMVGFIAMTSARIVTTYLPAELGYFSLFVPILIGIACGLVNGYFVCRRQLNALLATLGTLMVFEGGTLVASMIGPYGFETIFEGFPSIYLLPGRNEIVSISLLAIMGSIVFFVLRYTSTGTHIYSVGGDPESSRMMGISVQKTKWIAFIVAGVLAGFGALLVTGYMASVPTTTGADWLSMIFAGAIFGGVSSGRGSILDLIGGGMLIGTIESGLVMFAVLPPYRTIAFGVLVIAAVLLNELRKTIRNSVLRASRQTSK